jgi:hypothetical protein
MEGSTSCFSDTSIANHSHESVNQIFILKLFCKQALFYVLTTYKNIILLCYFKSNSNKNHVQTYRVMNICLHVL